MVARLSRRKLLGAGAVGAALAASSGLPIGVPVVVASGRGTGYGSPTAFDEPPAIVTPVPCQTMQGFGASGAWWPNDLVRFAPDVQEHVADLLFSPGGIGLSVYRYNIGGGGIAVTNPVRAPETFLVEPGAYDWDRDPGGRLFLRLAASHGVPILIGFVNSAPAPWTTNGESRGGQLRPGAEAEFAAYLADVVQHLRDAEGTSLAYVSPMNEPNNTFEHGGQEGMGVPPEQRAALIRAVGRALAERAPYCRVIADESSRAGEQFLRDARTWLGDGDTADHVAALAVHRYDYPNDVILRLVRDLGEEVGRPIWSTEICCIDSRTGTWGQQYDPTMLGALQMAAMIWQGLTVANDAAFHWWVALSSEIGADPAGESGAARPNDRGWNDGLLYYDPAFAENGNQQIYPTKRYFALGNFSRYIRPGDRRHEVLAAPPDLLLLACATGPASGAQSPPTQLPDGSGARRPGWVLVAINLTGGEGGHRAFRVKLPRPARGRLLASLAVETSEARSLEPVALPEIDVAGLLSARVPPSSITTFVLDVSGP